MFFCWNKFWYVHISETLTVFHVFSSKKWQKPDLPEFRKWKCRIQNMQILHAENGNFVLKNGNIYAHRRCKFLHTKTTMALWTHHRKFCTWKVEKKKKISLHGLFMIFCSKLGNSKQPCSSQNCMINSTICAVVDSWRDCKAQFNSPCVDLSVPCHIKTKGSYRLTWLLLLQVHLVPNESYM